MKGLRESNFISNTCLLKIMNICWDEKLDTTHTHTHTQTHTFLTRIPTLHTPFLVSISLSATFFFNVIWWIKLKLVSFLTELPFYPFIIESHIGVHTRLVWHATSLAPWHIPCEKPATLQRSTAVTVREEKKISNSWYLGIDSTIYTTAWTAMQDSVQNAVNFWILIIMLPLLDSWCYSANRLISSLIELCFQRINNRKYRRHFRAILRFLLILHDLSLSKNYSVSIFSSTELDIIQKTCQISFPSWCKIDVTITVKVKLTPGLRNQRIRGNVENLYTVVDYKQVTSSSKASDSYLEVFGFKSFCDFNYCTFTCDFSQLFLINNFPSIKIHHDHFVSYLSNAIFVANYYINMVNENGMLQR